MMRIFLILLVLALIWLAWRMGRAVLARRGGAGPRDTPRFTPTARCVQCGTHLSREQLNAVGLCARCAAR